jgi:hypothetical protein
VTEIEAAMLAWFHGPGYNAPGHGTPHDCAACYEAAQVAEAVLTGQDTP